MNVIQKAIVSGWFPHSASKNAAYQWCMDEIVSIHGKRIAEVESFTVDIKDGLDFKATMTVLLSAPDWRPTTEDHIVRGAE